MLPFHLSFDPAARGHRRRSRRGGASPRWLRDELLLFGTLAGFVALAYVGPAAGDAAARRATRSGSRSPPLFAGSLLAALEYAHVALLAVALLVALHALVARAPPAQRLVWLLARRRASRACSARSCSTCATSSTTARCTA